MNRIKDNPALTAPFLKLLSRKIRAQCFSPDMVEETLGWEKDHIRRLKDGYKNLHVEEVLSILEVIGVEPKAFFAELYRFPTKAQPPHSEIEQLSIVVNGVADALVRKRWITPGELAQAVAARAGKALSSEAP